MAVDSLMKINCVKEHVMNSNLLKCIVEDEKNIEYYFTDNVYKLWNE